MHAIDALGGSDHTDIRGCLMSVAAAQRLARSSVGRGGLRAACVVVLGLLVATSFAVSASASTAASSSLVKFTNFSSSGVSLCGYDQAWIQVWESVGFKAYGWTETRDNSCTSADKHNRPAGYMGSSQSALTSNNIACEGYGWYYNDSSAYGFSPSTPMGTTCPSSVRARTKGSEWDSDVDAYIVDPNVRLSPYLAWK